MISGTVLPFISRLLRFIVGHLSGETGCGYVQARHVFQATENPRHVTVALQSRVVSAGFRAGVAKANEADFL